MITMAHLRIARAGFLDGWKEPRGLSTSTNIDSLGVNDWDWNRYTDCLELLDRWINIGQIARAGFGSEAWKEGFWPFRWRNK